MFERFTPRARRVVVLAQDAALDMGHSQIRPEHLLLALQEGEGMASNAMAQCGVDGVALREKMAERIGPKSSNLKRGKVPFSPEAKKALELSLRAALALGHNYIGTEHIFLGVRHEAEQQGRTLDELLGVRTEEVRNRLMEMLGGASSAPVMLSPALQAAMNRARQQAGDGPLTTGHLLTAMVADSDSHTSRALRVQGITASALFPALAGVSVADTSDAAPSAPTFSITVGGATTVIGDPQIAAALQKLSTAQLRDTIKRALELAEPDHGAG